MQRISPYGPSSAHPADGPPRSVAAIRLPDRLYLPAPASSLPAWTAFLWTFSTCGTHPRTLWTLSVPHVPRNTLKNSKGFRRRRAVGFDWRLRDVIESNCPSTSKTFRIFQNFHEHIDGTVHTFDGTQYTRSGNFLSIQRLSKCRAHPSVDMRQQTLCSFNFWGCPLDGKEFRPCLHKLNFHWLKRETHF